MSGRSVVLAAALGLGCGGGGLSGPEPPVATGEVNVRDNFFSPVAASVGSQTTVTWTWQGANPHNVTFEDGQGSSVTQTAGAHQRTFAGAGTFRYRCTIHSSDMVGSVVVQ
jgi:plastocyanin